MIGGTRDSKIGRNGRALAFACAALALLLQIMMASWLAPYPAQHSQNAEMIGLLGDPSVICGHHGPASPGHDPQKDCDDCPICHGLRLTAWLTPPALVVLPIRLSRHAEPALLESVALAPSILLRRAQPRGPPAVA